MSNFVCSGCGGVLVRSERAKRRVGRRRAGRRRTDGGRARLRWFPPQTHVPLFVRWCCFMFSSPSLIDHCFIPLPSRAGVSLTWDGTMGDHAWLDLTLHILCTRRRRVPTKWECINLYIFREDIVRSMPLDFSSAEHFQDFVGNNMQAHRSPLSARECRKS